MQQSLAQLLQGPSMLAGWAQSELGGCKRGLLSCAPCPPQAGCPGVPQECRLNCLQAPAGLVQKEHWSSQGPVCGVAPASCWPTHRVGAPAPHPGAMHLSLYLVSPGQGPFSSLMWGQGCHRCLQSWGPRLALLCAKSAAHPVQPAAAQLLRSNLGD